MVKHQCETPTPCRFSEHYANTEKECEGCTRHEAPIRGPGHFDYGDHWQAKKPRVRILSDWSMMVITIDTETREVFVDWYGQEVLVGNAHFSEEEDTWMFEERDGLTHPAPEGRHTLGDEMEVVADKIDTAINENQGAWFKE